MTTRPSDPELRHKILRYLSEHTTEVEWAGTGASRAYADTVIALADWLATTEPDVPARGPGASRAAIDAREHAPEALVERMARAMWEVIAVRSAGVRDPAPWGCLGEHTRDTYRGLATAALRVVTERADGAL